MLTWLSLLIKEQPIFLMLQMKLVRIKNFGWMMLLLLEDLEAELADTEFHGIQVHMMNQVLHQSKLIQVDLTLLPLETVVDKTHKVDKEFFQQ